MSIQSFKHIHEQEESPLAKQARQLGVVHKGRGNYGPKDGDAEYKNVDGKLVPLDKKDAPKKEPVKKTTKTPSTGKSAPGKLSDREDNLGDGEIKQRALDLGIKERKPVVKNGKVVTPGWKAAPGNAASALSEIMSGESYHLLSLKPSATDEELAAAIYNQVKDTTLGKENTKGGNYKNKFEGRNKALWQLCTSIAKSGKKKYKMQEAGISKLVEEGKLSEPIKTRNFYGHEVSLAKQKELIEKSKGPYYTDQGVEIPKDVLLDLISQSGGGANPSDTATLSVDSKGAVLVAFHSDKVSTADIQANTTVNQGFNDKSEVIDGTTLSDSTKAKAKAIIEKGQKDFAEAELALKRVGQKEAGEMAEKDMAKVLDDIKNNRNSKDPVSSRLKLITKQRSKKAGGGSIFQDYIDSEDPSEEDLLRGFYKYMADPNRKFEPTADMVTLFQRSAAQQGFNLKSQISIIRERSILIQRETHAELNKTKVKLKSGATKGLGDYVEGKQFAEAMHISIVDGEKGKGVGKYPGAFKLNMGGTVVEGKEIAEALGIDSTDDFITHLEVGTPEEGEEFTYADKERTQITGRNIFVYAITKDGKKLPVGFKTQRSKAGQTGKLNETFQWSTDVQKKFKELNIDEDTTLNSFSESVEDIEERELQELFGSIPFSIDTLAWSQKHRGQKPKGNDKWKFDYLIPVRDAGMMYVDDGEFTYRGMFKKAVKALVDYLKKRASGKSNLKLAKVKLEP